MRRPKSRKGAAKSKDVKGMLERCDLDDFVSKIAGTKQLSKHSDPSGRLQKSEPPVRLEITAFTLLTLVLRLTPQVLPIKGLGACEAALRWEAVGSFESCTVQRYENEKNVSHLTFNPFDFVRSGRSTRWPSRPSWSGTTRIRITSLLAAPAGVVRRRRTRKVRQ